MKKQLILKKLFVSLLSTSLSFTTVVPVFATNASAELQPTYTYTANDENTTFEKISHSNKPANTADGIVDYVGNGVVSESDADQGDRGQSYSWATQGYVDSNGEEWVYIGTCYSAMNQTLQLMGSVLGNKYDEETMTATLNSLYRGSFFTGEDDNGNPGGILVKMNVNTGEVKLLMSKATTGTGVLFRNAITYNEKLYFCGSVGGIPSIYEVDPKNGDKITCVHQGMTLQEYYQSYSKRICSGIRGMEQFNNDLVISCVGLEGPYIAISSDPSSGEFTKIATNDDLFNYPAYHYSDSIYGGSIWEIIEYNGSLYVAICTGTEENKPDENTMQSFAIVRGDCNGNPMDPDSWKWTSVVGDQNNDGAKYTFGIDPERTRSGACNLVEYDGYLYIGEYNDEEIALENILFDKDASFMAENLRQSVSLYRMDKDENIKLVVGDATKMFPNGGISYLGSGFGKRENQYIWQSVEYDGKLYLGTFDTSSLLEPLGQFTNGDLLHLTKDEWKSQIYYLKVLFQLLASKLNEPETVAYTEEIDETNVTNVITEEEAAQMVEDAIEEVIVSTPATLSEDGTTASEILTQDQKTQMIRDIIDGILNEDITYEQLETMYELNEEMFETDEDIDELFSQSFLDRLERFVQKCQDFNAKVKEYYNKLLDGIDNLKDFAYVMSVLSKADRGFDLYVTEDGVNFTTLTTNGFGDPYNHGLRVFATLPNYLVIGTANPFYGTQIWRMKNPNPTPITTPTPTPTPSASPTSKAAVTPSASESPSSKATPASSTNPSVNTADDSAFFANGIWLISTLGILIALLGYRCKIKKDKIV